MLYGPDSDIGSTSYPLYIKWNIKFTDTKSINKVVVCIDDSKQELVVKML